MFFFILISDLVGLAKELLSAIGVKGQVAQWIIGGIALLSILTIVIKWSHKAFSFFVTQRRQKIAAADLHPFFSRTEIKDATRYFIPTRFQNVAPSEDEEPGRSHIASAKEPLIPLFLDKAFNNDKEDQKYYLILADSGMGKTTFMINLYLKYKFKKRFPWQREKYEIKLFPLADPKSFKKIAEIPSEDKENCILLLDAFDEDNKAIEDYESRIKELLELTWEFREIVITCRTQFFPSSKDEPTETGRSKFGPKGGQHTFQKIYISVFSEKDIKKYLKKKFRPIPIFPSTNYLKALKIVMKSPNLMMRPMLLAHIVDLVKLEKNFEFGYEIYEALIEQWLVRESNKPGIRRKYGNIYKQLLYDFSRALAKDLYLNKKERGDKFSLRADEIIYNPNGLQLKDIEGNNIGIEKRDQESRSLLNRNAIGEYKFSHKSIYEYFLAKEVFENGEFKNEFYFHSDLDTAKQFFLELSFLSNPNKDHIWDKKLEIINNLNLSIEEKELLISNMYRQISYSKNLGITKYDITKFLFKIKNNSNNYFLNNTKKLMKRTSSLMGLFGALLILFSLVSGVVTFSKGGNLPFKEQLILVFEYVYDNSLLRYSIMLFVVIYIIFKIYFLRIERTFNDE